MSRVVHAFTRNVPKWQPRVVPVKLNEASDAQLEALQVTPSNTKISDYVLVLAHDFETLKVRSPLFNAIMYDPGGLSRSERELGAIGASIINRCIYCAAVHADRHAKIEQNTDVTDRIFAAGKDADLSPRDKAIFDFSLKLSECPPKVAPTDLDQLRAVGLSDPEVLDLVLSTSLFGWANRLMHVLGDPVRNVGERK